MAGDSSFDVVSKFDQQELENAVNMTAKEIRNRYDFKGTDAAIKVAGDVIDMEASGEERVKAVLDVLQTMLVRRKIDLKALKPGEPRISGKIWKLTATMQQGIATEDAKKIAKLIRDSGPKGVKTHVQGDELRVSSKKRDDLQACQRLIKEADYDFPVQFANYR